MSHPIRLVSLCFCISSLTACAISNDDSYNNSYNQASPPPYGSEVYPQGYETGGYTIEQPQSKGSVVVPETYHVGAYHSPAPSKDVDTGWINNQNPQGYTIQLADGDKASKVANTMQKTPKSERTAEIKYQHDGKTYYQGVYGSYPNAEAAQKALDALPADVKQNAGIKTWDSVQKNTRSQQ